MPSDQLTADGTQLAPGGALGDGVLCNYIAGSSSYSREVGRPGLEFFSQIKTVHLEG